ncbi:T-complex protein 1 subunit beta-like [Culex quinquefasciatus]|uniref:T-complex protein 1 subunit beta-like n=1 Tax=Culex quinquefasciatus TaxID=7176 RepID=UPI0018E38F43|nr:T-complex protein 1 subunit beta-like [Culex quinquefasciatus]
MARGGEHDDVCSGVFARLSSFVGAIAIGNLVKNTLGPKGMDKILIAHGRSAGQVEVTNDRATILKAVGVDMSRFQDDEVGDGITSVTVLVAELLSEAEKLLEQKFHPQTNCVPAKLFAGCCLEDSFLDESFLLDKKSVVHKPKRIENAKILIANTPMDTDKIKVFGSSIKMNSMVAELEVAEKEKMKDKANQVQARLGRCDMF